MTLMMNSHTSERHSYIAIFFTLLAAIALTIVPLPDWLVYYRPAWVSLCLIYWAIKAPDQVGIGVAWMVGLLLDAFQGTLLGEYALLCMLVVFVSGQMHQRLRLFPILQQAVFVFLLLGIQFIMFVWIQGLSGHPMHSWSYGFSVLTSMLVWPFMAGFLNWTKW